MSEEIALKPIETVVGLDRQARTLGIIDFLKTSQVVKWIIGGIFPLSIFSVHDKFHRTLILSGFCLLKIAKISLNSSFFPKPIKR